MADTVKIKISQIKRKEMPSKFKEGETYNITTVLDEISGRKGAAIGAWTDSWKTGDTVEGAWEERSYKDKDGFDVKSWNITNPNKKEFKGGGGASYGPRKASIVDAYTIAATIAPLIFGADKTVKLDKISALADAILKKISVAAPAEVKAEGKDVDLDKEEKPKKKKEEVEEDFEVASPKKTPAKDPELEDDEDDDDDIF